MVLKNMLNSVVETKDFSNSVTLQSVKTNYGFFQNNTIIAPSSVETKLGSNPYETRLSYHKYDTKVNLLSASKVNDIKVNYIYSYSNTFPIAKIENADYTTVELVLGGNNAITNFSLKISPSDAEIKSFLSPLYNDSRLANAMVTTFTYLPLVGMTSQTDPNGITTFYEYDDFGRLKMIRNHDGNILKTFEYHYKP
jgi:YD repeat-containing protein